MYHLLIKLAEEHQPVIRCGQWGHDTVSTCFLAPEGRESDPPYPRAEMRNLPHPVASLINGKSRRGTKLEPAGTLVKNEATASTLHTAMTRMSHPPGTGASWKSGSAYEKAEETMTGRPPSLKQEARRAEMNPISSC